MRSVEEINADGQWTLLDRLQSHALVQELHNLFIVNENTVPKLRQHSRQNQGWSRCEVQKQYLTFSKAILYQPSTGTLEITTTQIEPNSRQYELDDREATNFNPFIKHNSQRAPLHCN
ncbi:hypothetical protein CEXT_44161 [Caerostris extrusa]|uniref:Uncharacterized protein n=1 Tax=Caerostris extrusa TaxID=172846 RepID=A0AAV4TEE4_CAEEX|nr:hypothetical protein CEXT_44161 [Caerostris extrusa]